MNTYACFIFLLAVGLSAQKSEFEIDFENMVNTVRLKDNRTLLNCTEKCDEVKEAACKCLNFTCSVGISFIKCIENGLGNLTLSQTENIIVRLKKLDIKFEEERNLKNKQLTLISPKKFLNNIVELYQKANAQKSG